MRYTVYSLKRETVMTTGEALIIKKVLVFHSLILNKDITRTIILGTLIFQQTMQHLIGLG